jgi:hypothetical protein
MLGTSSAFATETVVEGFENGIGTWANSTDGSTDANVTDFEVVSGVDGVTEGTYCLEVDTNGSWAWAGSNNTGLDFFKAVNTAMEAGQKYMLIDVYTDLVDAVDDTGWYVAFCSTACGWLQPTGVSSTTDAGESVISFDLTADTTIAAEIVGQAADSGTYNYQKFWFTTAAVTLSGADDAVFFIDNIRMSDTDPNAEVATIWASEGFIADTWYGDVWTSGTGAGWVYSVSNEAWQYFYGDDSSSVFVYDFNTDKWFWTSSDIAPYFYSYSTDSWFYFNGIAGGVRTYWNVSTGSSTISVDADL